MNIRSREQLQDYVNQGNRVKFLFFWGHQEKTGEITKSCLSQWYDAQFEEAGHLFITAEHYMMYHKAKLFGDESACSRVLSASNPGEAKSIGREVLGFDQAKWEQHRFEIVVNGNLAKFIQNPQLTEFFLNTQQRVLVEASPVDRIWGVGMAQDNSAIENPNAWKGLNLLGFALMEVRRLLAARLK